MLYIIANALFGFLRQVVLLEPQNRIQSFSERRYFCTIASYYYHCCVYEERSRERQKSKVPSDFLGKG